MAIKIIIATLIICGFLTGIRLMQSPRTALWGNRLGAFSMLAAIFYTIIISGVWPSTGLLFGLTGGILAGLLLAQSVKMIHMPQTVALLNGLGGAASALLAWAALHAAGFGEPLDSGLLLRFTAGLTLGIGSLTLSGSIIAVLKLQGLAFRQAIQLRGHGHFLRISILTALLLILISSAYPTSYYSSLILGIVLLSLAGGLFLTLRIGGADMPIIISLLNAFSGLAAAVAGLTVENLILAGTGALVGVAGLILTRIMCRAMNRSLLAVLAGFRAATAMQRSIAEVDPPQEESAPKDCNNPGLMIEDLPALLSEATKVIIVPGYGMAVAQAQIAVRALVDALEARNVEVKFAIHPVAGRMPGHMNVLLAEVGIDYEKLLDLDTINPQFTQADLAIIVGACDVINPAANSAEGTPISGMPILNAEEAKHIIICNLDANPGYSGVENLLYRQRHVLTIWGNAAETIPQLTALLK